MNRTKKINKNNTNNNQNSVPGIVFPSFKKTKKYISFFSFLSLILSLYISYKVIIGDLYFSYEQLNDLSQLILNVILVIVALGFTIFTLPIKSDQPKKEELLSSYIGTSLLLTIISIFSLILSYFTFFSIYVSSLYFCILLIILCKSFTSLVATIVAYFNIR